MIERESYKIFKGRLKEKRRLILCIIGPRQIGKTTMATTVLKEHSEEHYYHIASSNDGVQWINSIWDAARIKAKENSSGAVIIAIDEIQKVKNWSEVVKKQWDYDTLNDVNIKLVILGSSQLLIQKGLTESLAGRFELIQMTHWSYDEMNRGFGFSPEEYAWFGGYPGSAHLIKNEKRWKDYISNSLIETTISKDILMLTRITKPALLKQLFHLSVSYSGQIISYSKMLGQLQDAGNTTTLAHYLNILEGAGLSKGIQKIYKEEYRKRSSIPKLQVFNTALISGQSTLTFKEAQKDTVYWGRIIESCVGAHLINHSITEDYEVLYWRHINSEIDFVVRYKGEIIGIEVKSNFSKPTKGMQEFQKAFDPKKILLIENRTLNWQDFISVNPVEWFN